MSTNDNIVDYSIIDNDEAERQAKVFTGDVKKSILIEFNLEDYEAAYALCQYARKKDIYIGEYLINVLQDIKDGYESQSV